MFITWDEAGGYWDSGFIQPIDFFGDGPRIPLLVLSPYSTGGKVNHSYADHVSLLKFIERNWSLQPLTNRSRDNLPNPTFAKNNPMCRPTARRLSICSTRSTSIMPSSSPSSSRGCGGVRRTQGWCRTQGAGRHRSFSSC